MKRRSAGETLLLFLITMIILLTVSRCCQAEDTAIPPETPLDSRCIIKI